MVSGGVCHEIPVSAATPIPSRNHVLLTEYNPGMESTADYLKFYDDETYLLKEVGPRFHDTGMIEAADFYTILIWKANRAKNYHLKRLKLLTQSGTFQNAVDQIAGALKESPMQKERLRVLMTDWWFSLPTASAILTILYPSEFTVYDYRVCKELGLQKDLSQRVFSDVLWSEYESFRERVKAATPSHLSLRDKDRFLTGRSFRREVERDCQS
jgi:hypothetical protein